jgi:uncharacterized protein YndB with AHSA1/START domain
MTIELAYAESIEIDAPIEKVFDYRLDFVTLADYNHTVTNIRRTKDGSDKLGAGAEYHFDLALPGWEPMKAFLNVLDVNRPNEIVTHTGTEPLSGREVNTFETLDGGVTRFTISFSMELPDEAKDGVDWMEKSGRDSYRLELDVVKKILEAGA